MRQKVTEKLAAIKLRKQGKSVLEIAARLGVAKSSVSVWVRNVPLSPVAEKRLLQRISVGQHAGGRSQHAKVTKVENTYLQLASKNIRNLKLNLVHKRLLCSLIYWCEGAKSANCVDFTNADPKLVRLFLTLFRSCFVIDESKFRVCLHIHDYHDINKQIAFWSKLTTISPEQFIKPYTKPHTGRQIHEGYQGCVSVRYYNADIARQLHAAAKASFTILI
jgi:DNA-binding CsgD family transcriptional regulator